MEPYLKFSTKHNPSPEIIKSGQKTHSPTNFERKAHNQFTSVDTGEDGTKVDEEFIGPIRAEGDADVTGEEHFLAVSDGLVSNLALSVDELRALRRNTWGMFKTLIVSGKKIFFSPLD